MKFCLLAEESLIIPSFVKVRGVNVSVT
ncbi:hypothetical protein Goari_018055 [Gossypium aridum]|uniref:Uncharacterized protein n=1 Tax=Gossypium aridum TaxID=34290 RepID=A0A7J8WPH9_GOSAI|nr:hypothetical protein [Gossypium aridum]